MVISTQETCDIELQLFNDDSEPSKSPAQILIRSERNRPYRRFHSVPQNATLAATVAAYFKTNSAVFGCGVLITVPVANGGAAWLAALGVVAVDVLDKVKGGGVEAVARRLAQQLLLLGCAVERIGHHVRLRWRLWSEGWPAT
jgi:hypothetical protein